MCREALRRSQQDHVPDLLDFSVGGGEAGSVIGLVLRKKIVCSSNLKRKSKSVKYSYQGEDQTKVKLWV